MDLEILALFPVNKLVPDESLFVREVSNEFLPTARPGALAELRQVWM